MIFPNVYFLTAISLLLSGVRVPRGAFGALSDVWDGVCCKNS